MPSTLPRCVLGCLAACGAGALLVSCASVKVVQDARTTAAMSVRAPALIYVKPFDTASGDWAEPVRAETARLQVRDLLTARLENRLSKIAPTRRLTTGELPTEGWLVTGEFTRMNPGSRFQRVFLGFGAGASRMATSVAVYDLAVSAEDPLISFETSGGTNQQAGPAMFTNPTEDDADRTAREIRDYLQSKIWDPRAAEAR